MIFGTSACSLDSCLLFTCATDKLHVHSMCNVMVHALYTCTCSTVHAVERGQFIVQRRDREREREREMRGG